MNSWIRYIVVCVVISIAALQSRAETVPNDTVYFYTTWEQILNDTPDAMLENPFIYAASPYDIQIYTADDELNEMLLSAHIAACLGDDLWLISSEYIKKNFTGDVKRLEGFMLLFFNDKMAYFLSVSSGSTTLTSILFGESVTDDPVPNIFNIDFVNKKVRKVDHKVLSDLLEDYHDLQMRYEGMKDYKKQYVIDDYYDKYIKRATDDFLRPFILDLVD
ncbi:MAG: hypothetical protein IJV05_06915 [Muribaculaceae bacterium]|nr:hypothetical protein [Muribaculaceae bacterium]